MSKVIEDLLEKGLIKESQVQDMEDFREQIKEAGFFGEVGTTLRDMFHRYKKPLGYSLAAAVPGIAIGALGQKASSMLRSKAHKENIANSFNQSVGTLPEKDRQAGAQAFHTVREIAPVVSGSAPLMKVLVPEVMHKGLTSDRMMNLVQLEKNYNVGSANAGFGRGSLPVQSGAARAIDSITPKIRDSFDAQASDWATNKIKEDMVNSSILGSQGADINDSTKGSTNGAPKGNAGGPGAAKSPKGEWEDISNLELAFLVMRRDGLLKSPELKNIDFVTPEGMMRFNKFIQNNSQAMRKADAALQRKYPNGSWKDIGQKIYKETMEKKASLIGEFLADEYLVKQAFNLKGALGGLAIAGAAGAGFGLIEEAAHFSASKKQDKKLHDSWTQTKRILKNMPEQVSVWEDDKTSTPLAQEAFLAMKHVAPDLAENPVIAASFVSTIMGQHGKIDSTTVKTLTDAQKNYSMSHAYKSPFSSSPFFSGADKGFNTSGGAEMIKNIAKHSVN